jgi:hypothetical protein
MRAENLSRLREIAMRRAAIVVFHMRPLPDSLRTSEQNPHTWRASSERPLVRDRRQSLIFRRTGSNHDLVELSERRE